MPGAEARLNRDTGASSSSVSTPMPVMALASNINGAHTPAVVKILLGSVKEPLVTVLLDCCGVAKDSVNALRNAPVLLASSRPKLPALPV